MKAKTNTNEIQGRCYCGDIQVRATLSVPPSTIEPRKCDCSFCMKHGASYFSDSQGKIEYKISSSGRLKLYRQETEGTADFMICANCGVLMGVTYKGSEDRLFSTVNANIFDEALFLKPIIVSPKVLSREQKIQRWEQIWFPNVRISGADKTHE